MNRFLTLLMIVVLVFAHGSSVAAAICGHASGAEHVAALQSGDAAIANLAMSEETADKMASKRGPPADSGSVTSPSDMLPSPELEPPFRVSEPLDLDLADPQVLAGASPRPLLEPPTA